jgi:septum formation protein
MAADFVYLASGSPRRRELLAQIGVSYRVLEVCVDESPRTLEPPHDYVERLALAKAEAGWQKRPAVDAPVLAADTSVIIDGVILGKPKNRDEGAAMLVRLSGREHEVLTAVSLRSASGVDSRLSRSTVRFRPLTSAEISTYWDTGEPCDKAGGYAVQGLAAVFIAALNGSFSGVMGLPLFEAAELLQRAGVPQWRLEKAPR